MSKDKSKSLPRRLKFLGLCGSGYAIASKGRPPLNDPITKDCIKRGLIHTVRESTPGIFYNSRHCRTTYCYLTDAGIIELKTHKLWEEHYALRKNLRY